MEKREKIDPNELALEEKVVYINRVAKVMKGAGGLASAH